MNGFLNYVRQTPPAPPFNYVLGNNSSVTNSAPTDFLWRIEPCVDQGGAGSSFSNALLKGTGADWLYGYMNCVSTNPNVDTSSITVQRVRRAYSTTILFQIQEAIANLYDLSATDPTTGDPTYGAFGNLDANEMLPSAISQEIR
jgi:hypothetical protein